MESVQYTTVETAKFIRAELKSSFPNHKFSVRKIHGWTINIEYNGDETIRDAVKAIARKFECGSFDGMTDSMNYADKIIDGKYVNFSTDFVFVNCYGKAAA